MAIRALFLLTTNHQQLITIVIGGHGVEFEHIKPGASAEISTVVDDSLVVKHTGGDGVLSTPSMIGLMERAGIQAVQSILPEGYTTVGFEVHVKHFAPTAKGKKVDVLPGMNAGASTSAVPSPIEGSGTAWVLLGSWALSPARPTPIHPRPERRGFSALLVSWRRSASGR